LKIFATKCCGGKERLRFGGGFWYFLKILSVLVFTGYDFFEGRIFGSKKEWQIPIKKITL